LGIEVLVIGFRRSQVTPSISFQADLKTNLPFPVHTFSGL